MFTKKISIITATYNAAQYLPRLIASLRAQTNKNFEWIVADGGSTDGTLELLKEVKDIDVLIDSRPDFGIYDALNRAIKMCSGEYYLVLGADDYLYKNTIDNYIGNLKSTTSLIFSGVFIERENKVFIPQKINHSFLRHKYIGCHSVGTLVQKSLHQKYGFYSNRFPITADRFFLRSVIANNEPVKYTKFVSGVFGKNGASSTNYFSTLSETFKIDILFGDNKLLQYILFLSRTLYNYKNL